ncbi:uncharacterized protein LOC108209695 isoform X3 [Daucus carota subsp. sativus]|uniref:uncharacterized protein LOC108209695 isoform X3 n=1 Tax=Daucus carota subsp. sativus TaxID=79200 RepID=UPI0007F03041|nr:PREDICTED: uncharacterized protein LOC108209695 isoform X3 [Daucus carota subsp. sativus]
MRPVFNPRPNKQVMESNNKFQTNPTSLLPQMGLISPSNLNNNNFLNLPNNQFFPNGMLPLGQFPNGFVPQNFNMGMNQFNLPQLNGQILPQNLMNQGGGISFPNGQFFVQTPMQNMGQFVQMPMGLSAPFLQNQVRGPQNPAFNGNQQFGVLNFNGVSVQSNQQQNAANGNQQLQGNSPVQPPFGSVQSQQTQNLQPQVFNNQQGNPRNDSVINNVANNGRNSQSRNFGRHPRQDRSPGFGKSQNHHVQNGKGKFKNGRGAKCYQNERKFGLPDPSNGTQVEKKKFLPLNYTEQEIKQWREARKRHYPSKSNIEKKSKKKMAESELADTEAKLRRQQLKEVLVKQAELGCEVAEIPSHYLSDSEKQVYGAEQNRAAFNKKGKFRNRPNRRGKRENDRFAKKQRLSNTDSTSTNEQNVSKQMQRTRNNNTSVVQKREPSLLQKLLSADIRRDRGRLLQVFRFMVMNSFFKYQPEKPLMFPTVIVRETEGEGKPLEQKHSHDEDDEEEGSESQVNEMEIVRNAECEVNEASAEAQEEEGEIVD